MPVRRDEILLYFEKLRRLRREHAPICYGVAIATVAIAGIARWSLEGVLPIGPFFTFFGATMFAAFLGGLGPGFVAVILSVLDIGYFFMAPPFHMSWADGAAIGLFVLGAATSVGLIALLNEAIDRVARQEQTTRLILDTTPAGMIAVDRNGVITLVNATVEKLFGYSPDELIGRSIEVLSYRSSRHVP